MTKIKPYLSIVVTGRNDDYGGDFNERLQSSVRWWSYFAHSFKLHTEYVFVNYNPITDKKDLSEIIEWCSNDFFCVRLITVPESVHQKLSNPAIRKPNQLFEFIAKNIGIRRAKGEFILSTNADIISDPSIISFIAAKELNAESYYRADRADFKKCDLSSLDEIRQNIFSVYTFGKCADYKVIGNFKFSLVLIKIKSILFRKFHLFKRRFDWIAQNIFGMTVVFDNAEFYVHCGAAGDFMLMHSSLWHKSRAYPENFYMTTHNDSIFTVICFAIGIRQEVFFYPVYHQDHERRNSAENQDVVTDAYKTYKAFQTDAKEMIYKKKPIITNDESWGLINYNFEEIIIE
jgi:hypothetical protein